MKTFLFIRRFSYFDLVAMLVAAGAWENHGVAIGLLTFAGLAVASIIFERLA
jgi:hypothetical protein